MTAIYSSWWSQLPDLALGLLQAAFVGLERSGLQPLHPPDHEVIPPCRQPMGLDPQLPTQGVQVLAPKQAHHRVRIAPHRLPEELAELIRQVIRHSPFAGEGRRKVTARLRREHGVRVGRKRVLLLMRAAGLLAPQPPRSP